METMLNYLQTSNITEIASDPRALIAVGAALVLAVVFRWKSVLLLFFAVGGTMAIIRYSRVIESGGEVFDRSLVIFIAGCILVGVILIYFAFIRGD